MRTMSRLGLFVCFIICFLSKVTSINIPKMKVKPGSVVALVTPMTKTNDIDYSSFSKLLQWHLEEGSDLNFFNVLYLVTILKNTREIFRN